MNGEASEVDRARVVAVLRLYLEVERGLRPARTLRPILAEQAYSRLSTPGVIRPANAPMPGPLDIGRLIVQRNGRQLWATAPVRETAGAWGAVMLGLHTTAKGRQRVTTLERVHVRELPATDSPPSPTQVIKAAIHGASADLQAANAAWEGQHRRDPASTTTRRWHTRAVALRREIDQLRRSLDVLDRIEPDINPPAGREPPADYRSAPQPGTDRDRGLDL